MMRWRWRLPGWRLIPALMHSLNVVLLRRYRFGPSAASASLRVRVTGRPFGRTPGRTLRHWIRGRHQSRRGGHPRLRSMLMPVPQAARAAPRECPLRPGCRVIAAAAAPGLPLLPLLISVVGSGGSSDICPSCHGAGLPGRFMPQAERYVPEAPPETGPLPGSVQITLRSGLWFPGGAPWWARAGACHTPGRRR